MYACAVKVSFDFPPQRYSVYCNFELRRIAEIVTCCLCTWNYLQLHDSDKEIIKHKCEFIGLQLRTAISNSAQLLVIY